MEGKVDLMVASLVTSTALDFVCNLESKLIDEDPEMANLHYFMSLLFFAMPCQGHDLLVPTRGPETGTENPLDPVLYDLHVRIFIYAHTLLGSLGPRAHPDDDGWLYDPARDPKRQSQQACFKNRLGLLTVMTQDIAVYAQRPVVKQHLFADVLMEEMLNFVTTGKKTLTLIVANQLLFEVAMDGFSSQYRNALASMQSLCGMLETLDDLDLDKDGPKPHGVWTVLQLFGWHPWLCGQLQYLLLQQSTDVIIHPDAPWRLLLYSAQLYEACRLYSRTHGLDDVVWPDMDEFMRLYDKASLFLGRVPDTSEKFVKLYNVTLGVLARSYLAVMFRGWHFKRAALMAPLERLQGLVSRIRHVLEDLLTMGTASPARLDADNANFSVIADLRCNGKRLPMRVLLQFVEQVANAEHNLLRFDLFESDLDTMCANDESSVVGFILIDWWYGYAWRRYGIPEVTLDIMTDVAQTIRKWDRVSTRLPRSLHETYKQYKADTSQLAEWLVTTAESLDRAAAAPTPSPGARGKGKNKAKRAAPVSRNAKCNATRKNAKKQAPSVSPEPCVVLADGSGDAGNAHVIVKVEDFATLAQKIADAQMVVPVSVLKWASRAIRARRSCAEWFRRVEHHQEASASFGADKTAHHEYFITVLERVVEILAPHCTTMTEERAMDSLDCVQALTNRFAVLSTLDDGQVSGAVDELDCSVNADVSVAAVPLSTIVVYEIEHDFVNALFSTEDFFDGFQTIRGRVGDVWAAVLKRKAWANAPYEPGRFTEDCSSSEKFLHDLQMLTVVDKESRLYLQRTGVKQHLFANVLVEELRNYSSTGKMTLTLIVATQFLLDVHAIVAEAVNGGRVTRSVTRFRLDDCAREFCNSLEPANVPTAAHLLNMLKVLNDLDPDQGFCHLHLKARSYTTILLCDRHFQYKKSPTPLMRSSRFMERIHHVLEDLLTSGTILPHRLDVDDANFAGRLLSSLLDELDPAPSTGREMRRRRGKRLPVSALLDFVHKIVCDEFDLLRFDLLNLHLCSFSLLRGAMSDRTGTLAVQFGLEHEAMCTVDLNLVVFWVIKDWWFGSDECCGETSLEVIRDVAELWGDWAKTHGSYSLDLQAKLGKRHIA
ncbi:hypothetical protein GGF32_006108 [Allomyces javanicus]|nr:hypothetical protein GGF32_006108 [Allomyces javanicus]